MFSYCTIVVIRKVNWKKYVPFRYILIQMTEILNRKWFLQ